MTILNASLQNELSFFAPIEHEYTSKRFPAFPLSMVRAGETVLVRSVSGKDATRTYLQGLGFVVNARLTVVTESGGHVIVKIKEAKVAVSKALARRIMVTDISGGGSR